MLNPGTAGLALLLKERASRESAKTKVLEIFVCYGCSYSPLS